MDLFKWVKQIRDDIRAIRRVVETAFPLLRVKILIGDQYSRRVKMLDSQSQIASIEFDDALGFPTTAVPDSVPAWTEDSNGQIVSLVPSADGLSCQIAAKAPGNCNVSVALMVNGQQFAGSALVSIIAGAAVSLKLNLSAPIP